MSGLAEGTGGQVIPAEQGALKASSRPRPTRWPTAGRHLRPPRGRSRRGQPGRQRRRRRPSYTDSAFVSIGAAADRPDIVSLRHVAGRHTRDARRSARPALGLAGILAVACRRPEQVVGDRRMDAYFGEGSGKRKSDSHGADLKGSAVALTDKVVSTDLETRISQRLAGAGSALTASEWLLLHAGIAVGGAVVGFVLGGAGLAVLGLVARRSSVRGCT